MTEKKMYQTIVSEPFDGRITSATAPAFCHVGDQISVRELRVTQPKELPEGCSFERLEDDQS